VEKPVREPRVLSAHERFEACRARLKDAHRARILHDIAWSGSSEPRVVVGPAFPELPDKDKLDFANAVNCFLVAGARDQYISFDLLDWRTGHAVARYSRGKIRAI
jgi:hypothetical protein